MGGGIQVAITFISDLIKTQKNYQLSILMCKEFAETSKPFDDHESIEFIEFTKNSKFTLSRSKNLRAIEKRINPDIIFTVFGPSYHQSSFPKVVGYAIPHYIYEDSPFFDSLCFFKRLRLFFLKRFKVKKFVQTSNALIFETEDSRKRFVDMYGYQKPTYVVSNTLNSIFKEEDKWVDHEKLDQFSKDYKYVFCLSSNYPHKNLKLIPKILEELQNKGVSNIKFVVSLNKEDLGFDSKYNDSVIYLGKIQLTNLPSIYKKMNLVFMPTLLEVFSATYIEAMYMGIPLLVTDMSFARDICRDAAQYFPPVDFVAATNKIVEILEDENLQQVMVEKGKEVVQNYGSSLDRTNSYIEILKKHKV
ncbi:glycosyltransferase [Flavobacteriaceae bacterium]|nr:glycosyltransferase [Flavobacteriaceae bacterium]